MKTLKYLMLLLAVALALPAMAQEIEKMEAVEELSFAVERADDLEDIKPAKVTQGTLSKHFTYTVEANGSEMIARVEGKNVIYELVKRPNGVEKYCRTESSASICPPGFVHVKNDVNATEVLENFLVTAEKDYAVKEEVKDFAVRVAK